MKEYRYFVVPAGYHYKFDNWHFYAKAEHALTNEYNVGSESEIAFLRYQIDEYVSAIYSFYGFDDAFIMFIIKSGFEVFDFE